jgi:hypothetical protein
MEFFQSVAELILGWTFAFKANNISVTFVNNLTSFSQLSQVVQYFFKLASKIATFVSDGVNATRIRPLVIPPLLPSSQIPPHCACVPRGVQAPGFKFYRCPMREKCDYYFKCSF